MVNEDRITIASLLAALAVVGYLVYFTSAFASQDAGEYLAEKSLRNVEAKELPVIYKNAAAFGGKVNSLMYIIVGVGAIGVAVLTLVEYRKFAKMARE